ncbi:hypothetical protein [Pelagibacterium montanilacus]|uniref:hypothetical protein n=1 Tax=Pelagibacterium montanilacus TaxID=2185280 RepID=UPI000F8E15BD|nr:hypothetical protein [Pelagibacterium montanilacus]
MPTLNEEAWRQYREQLRETFTSSHLTDALLYGMHFAGHRYRDVFRSAPRIGAIDFEAGADGVWRLPQAWGDGRGFHFGIDPGPSGIRYHRLSHRLPGAPFMTRDHIIAKTMELIRRHHMELPEAEERSLDELLEYPSTTLGQLGYDSLDEVELAIGVEDAFPGIIIEDDLWNSGTTVSKICADVVGRVGVE